MELNEQLKNCLRMANPYGDLDIPETVEAGIIMYTDLIGGPIEVETDEEGEEFVKACFMFVFDCIVGSLEDKGLIEMKGMDEDGPTWGFPEGMTHQEALDRLDNM